MAVIIGAAGKSGSLSAVAARQAGAAKVIGVVPTEAEAALLRNLTTAQDGGAESAAGDVWSSRRPTHLPRPESPLVDEIVVADARDPVGLAAKVEAAGGPADVTVVCVDVPGCEGGAILSTKQGGTVIFFSMATSFSAAALGAEGLAADVTMLVGNGYVPGHADLALGLIRSVPSVRKLFEQRVCLMNSKLNLDPALVAQARELARLAGQPVTDLARTHTTVSVERAVLRLAGLDGADEDGMPWVNRLADAVRESTGLEHGVALPVWDAMRPAAIPTCARWPWTPLRAWSSSACPRGTRLRRPGMPPPVRSGKEFP